MNDRNFLTWLGSAPLWNEISSSVGRIQTPMLQPLAEAFIENAAHTTHLAFIPAGMAAFGVRLRMAQTQANLELTGDPFADAHPSVDMTVFPPVPIADGELWKRYDYRKKQEQATRDILSGKIPFTWEFRFNQEFLTGSGDEGIFRWIDQLMSAQLVVAWTHFETMVGDVLDGAEDAHPGIRANLGNNGRRRFSNINNIREDYCRAFPGDNRIGSNDFWSNRAIVSAHAIRNVIAHRAGKVDATFQDRICGDDRFSHLKVGDRLEVTGDQAVSLIRELFTAGAQLIRSVDDWITAHA